MVALSEPDRRERRAAHSHKGRKGRYHHQNWERDPDAGQREVAGALHMADIDPVHDVIKDIDKLCCHSRKGKAENQPRDGFRAQALIVVVQKGRSFPVA